jgi:hypothetical protein
MVAWLGDLDVIDGAGRGPVRGMLLYPVTGVPLWLGRARGGALGRLACPKAGWDLMGHSRAKGRKGGGHKSPGGASVHAAAHDAHARPGPAGLCAGRTARGACTRAPG